MSEPPQHRVQPGTADIGRMLEAALQHHQAGRLDPAGAAYEQLLSAAPGHPDALHLLGVLRYQQGRTELALTLLNEAVAAAPDHVDALCNLALVQKSAGDNDAAERSLGRALAISPALPAAHNNLGSLLLARGDLKGAIGAYREATRLEPAYVEALLNLANALLLAGHGDQALAPCRHALELQPGLAAAHAMMGSLRATLGEDAEATACYRRAFELEPDDAEYACNLASSLESERRWDEALVMFDRAAEMDRDCGPAISGSLMVSRSLCQWDHLATRSARFADGVRRGLPGLTPFIYLAEPSTAEEELACASLWSRGIAGRMAPVRKTLDFHFEAAAKDRITVAYFSYDFRRHPTAYTKVGLFENHDRGRFRVLGYCHGPDDDSAIRRRVIDSFDEFCDVRGWPPAEVARRIFADGVDILVDLKGHTLSAPTETFALRPAPIQVNYKGYPGTMGAEFIDYIVADQFVVPPSDRHTCAEQVIYLPETYWVDDSRRTPPAEPPARSQLGLPEDGIVFCCFNNSYKITPEMMQVWTDILKKVPGSVLWAQNSNPDSSLTDNLRREVQGRGLDPGRIVFAPRRPLREYLGLFRAADLFLDSRPYNAHTTASDALWAGLPVLTCPGSTFASRVAGSLLRTLGLQELVCATLDDYRNLAVALATDRERMARLRERLERQKRESPLYDTARLTRHMEAAYEFMFGNFAAGRPPAHHTVERLP
ncbi:MAG: tetratricopeptide repeat protein [Gammaproteobacteria bacterium]|jgi:tetratricopeptide (TPR) repeat protein